MYCLKTLMQSSHWFVISYLPFRTVLNIKSDECRPMYTLSSYQFTSFEKSATCDLIMFWSRSRAAHAWDERANPSSTLDLTRCWNRRKGEQGISSYFLHCHDKFEKFCLRRILISHIPFITYMICLHITEERNH